MHHVKMFAITFAVAVINANKVAAWGNFGNATLRSVAKTRNLLIGAAFKVHLIESDSVYRNFHR